ncbi:MAG: HAD-IIIC family phosphatase [Synergistaceae bacterium]|jgi:FkbH-like protein|nr:HAD-IIIC family phosphatase [Synergistaceae bacterium]
MTISILSNVTMTSVAMRAKELVKGEIYYPKAYNTWLQELANPNSQIYSSGPGEVFIVLHGRTLLGEKYSAPEEALAPIVTLIDDCASNHRDITYVVSTLDIPDIHIRPLTSRKPELAAGAYWRRAMEDIPVPILDLAELAANMGRRNFYNNRVWYMGGMPFSKPGEEAIADEIAVIWRAMHGARRKCLALDLDNTLWGGVIGELGIDGIHLDKVGSGSRFYDFQSRIRELKESGVLLAVLSKNNMDDALGGIDNHPDMLLRSNDFVAIKSNWSPKSQNLRALAEELNIGTDAFVFIDDNPLEREAMRIALPDVATPDFPSDSSKLEEFIAGVAHQYFLQVQNTAEDAIKTEQYAAEARRQGERHAYASIDEYLRSLDMVLSIEGLNAHNLPRASQLTNKTNQFNLTTYRYSEAELQSVMNSPDYRAYVGELKDRFGDYGKVIFCIVYLTGNETALIDTFLMSCRVMERGVERAFIRAVERDLLSIGVKTVLAQYIRSAKNSVASDFWSRVGYAEAGADSSHDGIFKYVLYLPYTGPGEDLMKVVEL